MAYNNYLGGGASFAPYNPSITTAQGTFPYPNALSQQPQQSGSLMTVFVSSEDEVNTYPVQAGTTVLLLCFPAKKFWLKSTSTNGVPEALREFPFEEKMPVQPQTQNTVTREEFDSLSKKIDKLIQELGGTQNG